MPSPVTLVTLDQAKRQLRIRHSEADIDIEDKLQEAEDIVMRYLNGADDPEWDQDTVPGAVRAAILRQTAHLFRFRGDAQMPDLDDDGLAPGVKRLLVPYRTPTIA